MKFMLMLATIALSLTGIMLLPSTASPAQAGRHTLAPICKYEDSKNCVWDARHRGNGEGRSFINRNGKVIFISHRAAHALTH